MALLEQQTVVGNGMVKEIEESAMSLVLQNLQQDHYQYPIKSFIREITSNSVDSIEEKIIATKILKGEAKVSDYYSDIESDITKDSKFDHSYYSLDHLNDNHIVNITYVNRDRNITNRDLIVIEDSGVGLGGKRLQGFFRPAFSTKRLSKHALGKFGIGSKSGLATGVESYQLVSVYNGKEYHFDIYEDRFYSTVPKFSESGDINPHEIWRAKKYNDDGTISEFDNEIYYIPTEAKNGVKILLDVKNPIRNKSKFKDAVKSQLTYFDYVRFFEEYENPEDKWLDKEINFKTEILYKDEHLIIPVENYYSVPHLVLNGVNYGTIDFAEMEMDQKKGNIGIIGDPNEIDVNQSRETVRYTEKTREAIKKYLNNSIKVAQSFVDTEMKSSQDDFIQWALSCRDLKAKNSRDNVFSRLSGLADLSSVELTHKSGIKFNQTNFKKVFTGFKITRTNVFLNSSGTFRTNTVEVNSWENFNPSILYYRDNITDRISSIVMGYIAFKDVHENPDDSITNYYNDSRDVYLITLTDDIDPETIDTHNIVKSLVLDSKTTKNYTDVVVPDKFVEEFKAKQEDFEKKEEAKAKEALMTEKEIRKQNGLILYHNFVWNSGLYSRGYKSFIKDKDVAKTRVEISINDVPNTFNKEDTIYGTQEDIPLLKTLITITDSGTYSDSRGYKVIMTKHNFKIIVVSKEVVKYIDNHATHVKQALQNISNNKISIMSSLKNFNTAKEFKNIDKDKNFQYLHIFEQVDKQAFDVYQELISFLNSNGFRLSYRTDVPGTDEIFEYMDNLKNFQLYLINEDNPSKIAAKSKELFNTESINSCDAVNMEMYVKFKALEDYIEDMKELLKPYSNADHNAVFNYEAIREYINLKGIPNYSEFLASRCEEFKVPIPKTQESN